MKKNKNSNSNLLTRTTPYLPVHPSSEHLKLAVRVQCGRGIRETCAVEIELKYSLIKKKTQRGTYVLDIQSYIISSRYYKEHIMYNQSATRHALAL